MNLHELLLLEDYVFAQVVVVVGLVGVVVVDVACDGASDAVSYTHLTLPTIYSV